jgi:hypothetical protein
MLLNETSRGANAARSSYFLDHEGTHIIYWQPAETVPTLLNFGGLEPTSCLPTRWRIWVNDREITLPERQLLRGPHEGQLADFCLSHFHVRPDPISRRYWRELLKRLLVRQAKHAH